jgi:hypothetical protein
VDDLLTAMDRTPRNVENAIEQGMEAYFTAEGALSLLQTVDWEAVLLGVESDAPIDFERVGEITGQFVGRLVVRRTIGQVTPGGMAEQTLGYTVGGLIGKTAVRVVSDRELRLAAERAVRRVTSERSRSEDHTVIDIEGPEDTDDEEDETGRAEGRDGRGGRDRRDD